MRDDNRRMTPRGRIAVTLEAVLIGLVLAQNRVALAGADAAGGGHADPFAPILLELAVVIVVAMLGRWMATAAKQPAVLGELLIGVVIGNIGYWLGQPLFVLVMDLGAIAPLLREVWNTGRPIAAVAQQLLPPAQLLPGGSGEQLLQILSGPQAEQHLIMAFSLWLFSNLGVIILLFMVGLESTVTEMLRTGPRALAVGVVGVVAPFLLGFYTSRWLIAGSPFSVDLFMGATLCATSVGITARVFKDLGLLQSPEARVILGAAVIDDILGLIILAIVVAIVATGGVQLSEVLRITVLSAVFLGGVIVLGERLVRTLMPMMVILDRHHVKLLFPLALAFGMAWLASQIDLAAIVGAFAAGLILTEELFSGLGEAQRTVEEMIRPLEAIFAPVFFVLMGMQVNLGTFASGETVGMALGLTVAAVAGKWVCGLVSGPETDHTAVGVGMIPRGEVGLIFASIGKGLGVVTEGLFSAVVMMVMITTLAAPPLLKWSLSRRT
jgi:Kef-type K+ transport system membrane component KefB